jgi:hypothetical protein
MKQDQVAPKARTAERGSALVYILIAIALLAALTVSFMQPSGNQTQSQNVFKTVSELQSQADFIRATVQECVLSHSGGDRTINTAGGGSDPGANLQYPLKPSSTHFTGATVGPTVGSRLVRDIRCPGDPGDNPSAGETVGAPGNARNHARIFGGSTGRFMPPPPALFNDWQWYNGTDGVFFWISSGNSDAFIADAYDRLKGSFAACEADIVTGATNLDVAGETSCGTNNSCFRVWVVRKTVCP